MGQKYSIALSHLMTCLKPDYFRWGREPSLSVQCSAGRLTTWSCVMPMTSRCHNSCHFANEQKKAGRGSLSVSGLSGLRPLCRRGPEPLEGSLGAGLFGKLLIGNLNLTL